LGPTSKEVYRGREGDKVERTRESPRSQPKRNRRSKQKGKKNKLKRATLTRDVKEKMHY